MAYLQPEWLKTLGFAVANTGTRNVVVCSSHRRARNEWESAQEIVCPLLKYAYSSLLAITLLNNSTIVFVSADAELRGTRYDALQSITVRPSNTARVAQIEL